MRPPHLLLLAILVTAVTIGCSGDSDSTPPAAAIPSAVASLTPTAEPSATASTPATSTPAPAGTPTGAPRPVSTPTPDPVTVLEGIPEGAIGPLLVFATEVSADQTADRVWPRFAIVTYDLGADQVASSFEVGTAGSYVSSIALARREVVVNYEHSLYRYALNGEETGVLVEPAATSNRRIGRVLLSPDGTRAVFARWDADDGCDRACLVMIDVASGSTILELPATTPGLDTLGGQFADPIAWHADGEALLVAGQPNGHRFFGWATVSLDGSVRNHGLDESSVWPLPSARRALSFEETATPWVATDLGCELTTRFDLHDLDEDRVLAEFRQPGAAARIVGASPDGEQLLVAWRVLPAGGSCGEDYAAWLEQPANWQLIDTTNGASSTVEDPESVQRGWYPTPRLELLCGGVEPDIGSTRRYSCDGRGGGEQPVDIAIDGRVIDRGLDVRFLGTIPLADDQ